MKKIFLKLFIILSLFCTFSMFISNFSMAESWKEIDSMASDFIEKGKQDSATIASTEKKMSDIVIPIAQILVAIGTIVVVVAATVMGIKYMVASPEEKAKLKTQLIGLVVATIVIFAAQFIWSTVYNFFVDF